jgi:hypothetical protein
MNEPCGWQITNNLRFIIGSADSRVAASEDAQKPATLAIECESLGMHGRKVLHHLQHHQNNVGASAK